MTLNKCTNLHKPISQSSFSTISKKTKLHLNFTEYQIVYWHTGGVFFFVLLFCHSSRCWEFLGLLSVKMKWQSSGIRFPTPIVHMEKHTVVLFCVMLCWLHVACVSDESTRPHRDTSSTKANCSAHLYRAALVLVKILKLFFHKCKWKMGLSR